MIKYIKNFFLCLKYPFLRIHNVWTGKFCGYSSTWYDFIEKGWQIAFGKQLLEDLKVAIKKDKCKHFRIEDVKEKWGLLQIYTNYSSKEVDKVLAHYELLSSAYCWQCGKPTRYCTKGYILYYCSSCMIDYWQKVAKFNNETLSTTELVKKLNENKLTKEDITTATFIENEIQKDWDETYKEVLKITKLDE